MRVEAKCKFCGCSLSLSVDDDYAAAGDPAKLYPMAACNRCNDYETARRRLFYRMSKVLALLRVAQGEEKLVELMRCLLKRYMRLVADHLRQPVPDWDEAILEAILSKPDRASDVIARIPAMFRQEALL